MWADQVVVLLERAHINRATAFGIINLAWRLASAPVSAVLIVLYLTPEAQGFYYTFGSLLAAQVFAELGFSNIITYFASHEWAALSFDRNGNIIGDTTALSRLVSLGKAAARWYFIGGTIVTIGLGLGGYVYFSASRTEIHWAYPWLALCILNGLTFVLIPLWSLLEGCNEVASVYFFRVTNTVLTSFVLWTALYLGAGLWAVVATSAAAVAWSLAFLIHRYRRFVLAFASPSPGPSVSWRGEIWQVQWRTAVSYLSGYFGGQVFTPVIFHYYGPILAGQFGMTWSIASIVAVVSGMWSTPRGPQFAMMIARKEYQALDRLLYRISLITLGVMLLGALAAWLLVYVLNGTHHPFAARFLSPRSTALLLLGVIVGKALGPAGVYIRAHKQEPYVVYSVVYGVLTGASVFVLGSHFADLGVAIAYLACNLLIAVPAELFIFLRCRQQWHA